MKVKVGIIGLVFVGIVFLLNSCQRRVIKEGLVTYKVAGFCAKSCRLCISYKDPTGTVRVCTTERNWSKEVYLTPGEMASLWVMVEYTPNKLLDKLGHIDLYDGCDRFVFGQIIYKEEAVSKTGVELIRISLIMIP